MNRRWPRARAQSRSDVLSGSVFKHTLRVRYSECDPQGVVFNANYVAYFDVVITELWREAVPGGYQAMLASGADMVVAEVNVRFVGSAAFDDEIDFEARVTRLGETAVSTRINSSTGGQPVVEAEIRHVCIDPETKTKRPIPAEVRAALEPYLSGA